MTQNTNGNYEGSAGSSADQNSSVEDVASSAQTAANEAVGSEEKVIKMDGPAEAIPAADPAAEWKSKVAYLSAEIDNMRKRFAREKLESFKYANEEIIKKFLPVLDCLELALKSAKDAENKMEDAVKQNPMLQNLIKGLDMTLKVFEQTLESNGCTPVKGVGETFDPTQHEALGQSQDLNLGENKVSSVMQRGFTLSGRVIRTAKVLVNKISN